MAFDPQRYSKITLESLENSLVKERFPHTLLIHGPKGIGKEGLAVKIAQTILCAEAEKSWIAPCQCSSCHRIAQNSHPDVKIFRNLDEATIKVDSIREMIDWLRFHPLEGNRKVLILPQAEKLVDAALNAFLKMLEEPPESSRLILLTEAPNRLKETLRSRCFSLPLRPMSSQEIESVLVREGASPSEARYLGLVSQGIYEEAHSQLTSGLFQEDDVRLRKLLSLYSYELVEEILGRQGPKRSQEDKRELVAEYLRVAQTFLRDVYLTQMGRTNAASLESRLYFLHRREWIQKFSVSETPEAIYRKLSKLEETRKTLRVYANPRLALLAVAETIQGPILEMAHA